MPSISEVGNISPVSTTTMRPSYSTTIMFFPISPRPPSGRIRSVPPFATNYRPSGSRGNQPVPLEHRAHLCLLFVRDFDQWETQPPDLEPEHVECRFHRRGANGHEDRRVGVLELFIDLLRAR